MDLLSKLQPPILDVLTRIYRHNREWVQTTQKYKSRRAK